MKKFFPEAEQYRTHVPPMPATSTGDRFGCFIVKSAKVQLRMIVDDGAETGWEHVSVSCKMKTPAGQIIDYMPTWDLMCYAKNLFWEPEECVLQFHPPASQYVNRSEHVLHLWRRVGVNAETPPTDLV